MCSLSFSSQLGSLLGYEFQKEVPARDPCSGLRCRCCFNNGSRMTVLFQDFLIWRWISATQREIISVSSVFVFVRVAGLFSVVVPISATVEGWIVPGSLSGCLHTLPEAFMPSNTPRFLFAFHSEEHCCHYTFSSIAASIQPIKHLGLYIPLAHFASSL